MPWAVKTQTRIALQVLGAMEAPRIIAIAYYLLQRD